MSIRNRIADTGRLRAAVEAGLLVFALALPLVAILQPAFVRGLSQSGVVVSEGIWPVLGIGMVYAGHLGALLGALRARRSKGGVRKQLPYELAGAAAIVLAVWAAALLALAVGAAGELPRPPGGVAGSGRTLWPAVLASGPAVEAALGYPVYRGVVLAWPAWNRLRRTRLLWALTHAQLVGVLLLAVVVAALSTLSTGATRFGPPFGPEVLPGDAGAIALLLAWLTTRLLPALTELLVLGVAAAVLLLPPAALISYLVLRRTTRRLEGLAAATESLRAGDLSARVPVGGEDEVGRLQADFNAMALDLERTLRDLQAERDRVAGLLESRRQLVAGVSHELRTPIATVRGYLEAALLRDGSVSAELRAELETMQREVERLQRLTEDLFTLSRAEVGRLELRLEPTDVGVLVRRLVDAVAPLAWRQRRVELLAELPPDLPPARADAGRVEQIVSNLLSNAVRYTPPGGLVAASVAAEPGAVRIEVRDTGEGIAPEDLPRVFERFYRGPGEDGPGGAGLGLALAKELAEAMGGSIEAASAPGEGSRFSVRLPRE